MFFYLSKILAFLLSPLVWVFTLLLIALLSRHAGRSKKFLIAGIVVFYLCSNSFVVDELFRAWEPVTKDHDLSGEKFKGAIILGGLGDIDLRLGKVTFGMAGDRLFQVLPLLQSGKVGHIVFTGGSGSIEFPEKREGIFIKKYLNKIGIHDSDLVIESRSRNTFENAIFTKHIFDSLNLKGRYLLVTSAYHMPRAMAVFKKAGYKDLEPYITNKSSGLRRFTLSHVLIPDAGAVIALQSLIHEWAGYLTYKLRGYA
jgi:uncharacterized SAM-binding protein YcdF (DUF218 family)